MRQYRAIPIDGKDFVYGWYFEDPDGFSETPKSYIRIPGTRTNIEIIPESVGQQVIVKGKEFYEGDVTKDDSSNIGVVRFGELPLDKSGDCVCTYPAFYIQCLGQLGQAPPYACEQLGEWMEIIGTIHTTHPELLENKND